MLADGPERRALLRRGFALDYATLNGILATAVLAGLLRNATAGWWWAGPAAGYVLVGYAAREAREIFSPGPLAA
jgi:hypothetical protein